MTSFGSAPGEEAQSFGPSACGARAGMARSPQPCASLSGAVRLICCSIQANLSTKPLAYTLLLSAFAQRKAGEEVGG